MNPLLEVACTRWIIVDLESFLRISNVFWFFLLFKSLFWWNFPWIHRFTTVDSRCKPWNPSRFRNFFRVSKFFEPNSFELLRIYVDSVLLMFLSMNEVSFDSHLCFIRRFELDPSELFGFDSVLLILAWNLKINRWFFFFFFSIPFLCDRIEFVAFGDEFSAWIAEEVAQWWRFDFESLRANTNSIDLVLNLLLKTVRVCEIVLQFSEFSVSLI